VDHYGGAHQLYNIAGLGGGAKSIEEESYEQFERVLGVNVWGVIHGTKEFLPHLIASGDGHIVNISSFERDHGATRNRRLLHVEVCRARVY